jgi:hypothetical protein
VAKAKQTRARTISYKLANMGKKSETLQSMLERLTMNKGKLALANDRKNKLTNDDDSAFHVLNKPIKYQGIFFCELLLWEPGQSQRTIELDDKAESFSLRTIKPTDVQKDKTKKEEFLESSLHIGVLDNHVVLSSSRAISSRDVEKYLAWLLTTKSDALKDSSFWLSDQPTQEAIKKLEKQPVRRLSLGTPISSSDITVEAEASQAQVEQSTKASSVHYSAKDSSLVKQMVASLFNALGSDAPDLIKDTMDESNLQLRLEITYLRKTDAQGQKFLDSISTSLRHQCPEDVEVELEGGGKLTGNDLKLTKQVHVLFNDDGTINENDLHHHIFEWLKLLIDSNGITLSA